MYMTKNSKAPILKIAGREMIRANRSLRMPLAALIRRKTRPILKTLTTRSIVGFMATLFRVSSRIMSERESITHDKEFGKF